MPLDVVVFSSNGLRAQLSSDTNYGIREGSSLGLGEPNVIFAPIWARGYHPPVGYSYGNRQAIITHRILDTSLDNWALQYRQLAQIFL